MNCVAQFSLKKQSSWFGDGHSVAMHIKVWTAFPDASHLVCFCKIEQSCSYNLISRCSDVFLYEEYVNVSGF